MPSTERVSPCAETGQDPTRTPCPGWCRDDHADGALSTFHQSPPRTFWLTHGETTEPEEACVLLQRWVDVEADATEPAAVVLEQSTDCWGQTWLTAEQAVVLASHLTAAAAELRQR